VVLIECDLPDVPAISIHLVHHADRKPGIATERLKRSCEMKLIFLFGR
jgi:hypothetical protein